MFSTCPAFVTGLVDSLGSDFHGGSFGESELHGVSMLGALGGQV